MGLYGVIKMKSKLTIRKSFIERAVKLYKEGDEQALQDFLKSASYEERQIISMVIARGFKT